MNTLYISDLDGTLLQKDATCSPFTIQTINALVEQGIHFTYATARSIVTAAKVTQGLQLRDPVIVHNGTFLRDPQTGDLVSAIFFGPEFRTVLEDLLQNHIYPIVYSLDQGEEKYRYWVEKMSPGMARFLSTRDNDPRDTPVHCAQDLFQGDPYYITCIDAPEKLRPFQDKYAHLLHPIFYQEIYSGDLWLELMPKTASKSAAALALKKRLGCDRLVVFGDGKNDIDLFRIADEAYAVANAGPELKALATATIDANHQDAVANWLLANI
ncbi:MAG: HAD-IIB family hydrolase [Oscillospiraceae bacterium]|nr:HAD-IIB family hydrolase [Oscillospiraceae bacterium]